MAPAPPTNVKLPPKFRGVALSHNSGAAGSGSLEEGIIQGRDAGFAQTEITVSRMLQSAPAGLEHIKLEPLSPSIGTVIHGVDLAKLTEPEVKFIRQVWLDRKVVMFRNQGHLTRQQHLDFANKFGDLGGTHGEWEHEPSKENTGKKGAERIPTPEGFPQISKIYSTKEAPGAAAAWHSDATWAKKPPMGSILLAREVPPIGGCTVYCDAYAMYEGLSPKTKKQIQNLTTRHVGNPYAHGDAEHASAEHPLLRTHPETGGTTLFVNPGFVKDVIGMPNKESAALLDELFQQVHVPEYQCRFQWEEGSVAMWDNRACQHYASGDYWPHERKMERVTIVDPDPANKAPFYRPKANL